MDYNHSTVRVRSADDIANRIIRLTDTLEKAKAYIEDCNLRGKHCEFVESMTWVTEGQINILYWVLGEDYPYDV